MIRESNLCYPNVTQPQQVYPSNQESMQLSSYDQTSNSSTSGALTSSLLYNLSILKEKVHQVQSLATMFIGLDHDKSESTAAVAIPTMGTLIHEIIITASSMLFNCQQMSLGSTTHDTPAANNYTSNVLHVPADVNPQGNVVPVITEAHTSFDWYDHTNYNDNGNKHNGILSTFGKGVLNDDNDSIFHETNSRTFDLVELDAADILAKYTHYCQVCGKGFKRDANLRMHMRAHGEEYKSSAALRNPLKNKGAVVGEDEKLGLTSQNMLPTKYSCPQEGCRWNKKHVKFQPLKSMICMKNHYKRSHCPKMYVCKGCNRKRFSVLSDLRTHEKHCGNLRWQCSCGSTFSRKDKLTGHVALFIGHFPLTNQVMDVVNVVKVDQSIVDL